MSGNNKPETPVQDLLNLFGGSAAEQHAELDRRLDALDNGEEQTDRSMLEMATLALAVAEREIDSLEAKIERMKQHMMGLVVTSTVVGAAVWERFSPRAEHIRISEEEFIERINKVHALDISAQEIAAVKIQAAAYAGPQAERLFG